MRFRPTLTLWYILAAPFVTLLLLSTGCPAAPYILFLAHLALTLNTVFPCWQGFGPVVTNFRTKEKEVWITLDDGPDPQTTPQILELLERFEAKATFFLVGRKMQKWPELVRAIHDAGHTIGNHTYSHPHHWFWGLGPRRIDREISEFELLASKLQFPISSLFRSPTGMKNVFVHPILARRDLILTAWSGRAFDTTVRNPQTVVDRLRSAMQPGAILLLHEACSVSVPALERLLFTLREQGFGTTIPFPNQLLCRRKPFFSVQAGLPFQKSLDQVTG